MSFRERDGKTIGVVKLIHTKFGVSQSASSVAENSRKVEFYLEDKLSFHLLSHWYDQKVAQQAQTKDFVFPAFGEDGQPNFEAKLPDVVYNESVRKCAAWLGLETDPAELLHYTSTSLRRGNAATIEKEVQRVRAGGQQHYGWSPHSIVPGKHYTPQRTMLQARPLVSDLAAANEKFDQACHAVLLQSYSKMLCSICGFPDCGCQGCGERVKIKHAKEKHQEGKGAPKTSAKTPHTCWRQGNSGGKPKKTDPIEDFPTCQQQREEAWAAKGCTLTLQWKADCYEYQFQ